eukprot:246049_1
MPKFEPFGEMEENAKKKEEDLWLWKWKKNDSKSKTDWNWVGVGGSGVIRVDYHSPYSIGWDNCFPSVYLGTDGTDQNENDDDQSNQNA